LSNAYEAPDGEMTADAIVETTANGSHEIVQAIAVSNTYRLHFSAFVKPLGRNLVTLSASGLTIATFNLNGGDFVNTTIQSALGDVFIQPWGNGWHRVGVLFQAKSTTNYSFIISVRSAPDLSSYVGIVRPAMAIWGVQVSQNGEPDIAAHYIPTTSAAVSRVADTVPYYKADDGNMCGTATNVGTAIITLFCRARFYYPWFSMYPLVLYNGATPKTYMRAMETFAGSRTETYVISGAEGIAGPSKSMGDEMQHAMRMDWETNHVKVYCDKSPGTEDTSNTPDSGITRIYLCEGSRGDKGLLTKVRIWPTRQADPNL
jgi:hypothetical protein